MEDGQAVATGALKELEAARSQTVKTMFLYSWEEDEEERPQRSGGGGGGGGGGGRQHRVEASGRRITAKAPQPVTNGKGKRGSAVSKDRRRNMLSASTQAVETAMALTASYEVFVMSGGYQAIVPGGGVKTPQARHGCSLEQDTAAELLMSEACRAVQAYPKSAGKLPLQSTASAGSRTSTSDSILTLVSPASSDGLGVHALEEVEEVEANFETVSREVQQWRPESFQFQRTLQRAGRNQGLAQYGPYH
ncbi:hypothetical protein AK812_SmicGene13080 [Symbiodinium microadriaticum]|uniref:Uncharacterized protein n=1 Tax=Symbiodinium microadriaticum TaxID=2951 RepID=A0A1Q9E920_SYMMI|nr:hypothetical protein AK812_SmicGene13080 [Symbiodinium microadriaticum]